MRAGRDRRLSDLMDDALEALRLRIVWLGVAAVAIGVVSPSSF